MTVELSEHISDRCCINPVILPSGTIGTVLYETTDKNEYCVLFTGPNYRKSVLVEKSKLK